MIRRPFNFTTKNSIVGDQRDGGQRSRKSTCNFRILRRYEVLPTEENLIGVPMIRDGDSIIGKLMAVHAVTQGKREEWPIVTLGLTYGTEDEPGRRGHGWAPKSSI
jgi:hypothetical protein